MENVIAIRPTAWKEQSEQTKNKCPTNKFVPSRAKRRNSRVIRSINSDPLSANASWRISEERRLPKYLQRTGKKASTILQTPTVIKLKRLLISYTSLKGIRPAQAIAQRDPKKALYPIIKKLFSAVSRECALQTCLPNRFSIKLFFFKTQNLLSGYKNKNLNIVWIRPPKK